MAFNRTCNGNYTSLKSNYFHHKNMSCHAKRNNLELFWGHNIFGTTHVNKMMVLDLHE